MFFPTKNGSTHLWISLGKPGFVSRSNQIKPLFNGSLLAEPSRPFPRMHFETSRAAAFFTANQADPSLAAFSKKPRPSSSKLEPAFDLKPASEPCPRHERRPLRRSCGLRLLLGNGRAVSVSLLKKSSSHLVTLLKRRSCCWPQLFEKIVPSPTAA